MKSTSILNPWVSELGLRHQGVLLAIRGCDIGSKHAPEKPLLREMRGLVLVPFDARELEYPTGFITGFNESWSNPSFKDFRDDIDRLPMHFVIHLTHAMEVIG